MEKEKQHEIFSELFKSLLKTKKFNIREVRFPEVEAIVELSLMSKEEIIEKFIYNGIREAFHSELWRELVEERDKLKSQIKKLKASAKKPAGKKSKK